MKQIKSIREKIHNTIEKRSRILKRDDSHGGTVPALVEAEKLAIMESETAGGYMEGETATVYSSATNSDALGELKRFVLAEPGIDKSNLTSTQFLVRFLRSAEMDSRKALILWRGYARLYNELKISYSVDSDNKPMMRTNTINSTLSMRSLRSAATAGLEQFMPLEIPRVSNCLSSGWVQCPPSRDIDGSQVLYIFPNRFDPQQFNTIDVCAAFMNLTNSLLTSIHTQQIGFCIVIDARNTKSIQVDVNAVQKTIFVLFNCLPIKVNQLLIIGFPTYAKVLWRSTQSTFSEELRHNAEIIQGKTKEAIGFELEQFIEESQRLSLYDGTLDWDVNESMKEWVLSDMML